MKPPLLKPLPGAPKISICSDRQAMGRAAAEHVLEILSGVLSSRARARVIFACAPSQDQFLESLVKLSGGRLDWGRITAFHMDEYEGLGADQPASFRAYLRGHLLDHVGMGEFHPIEGQAPDAEVECRRYAALVDAGPIDLICLGIGENGHLAFNDPPVADFGDTVSAKVVELDEVCRMQQVHDGCFGSMEAVPRRALTLTLPVFLRATHLSVVVPGERKAAAVRAACRGPVSERCPASLLQTRGNAVLFTDRAAAAGLGEA